MVIGIETPIPPVTIDAAAPKRDAPAAVHDGWKKIERDKPNCPAVPRRGPEAGSFVNVNHFSDFPNSGINPISSCPFL